MSQFKEQTKVKNKVHGHFCPQCLTRWTCPTKNRAECPRPDATLCGKCEAK